ncbi:MAG TPA: hypothetical protein VEA19_04300, partial [Actinomycetota bacterium]|nr:hypothetical protein [Actinomycetota bacterium]
TGTGYEPGLRVDSKGTIFYTSHKVFPLGAGIYESSENRMASWLYRSADNGKTWTVMEGGLAAENKFMPALEGDIAIDAKDRMYFVDTWALDNSFSRWSNNGTTLDFVRPIVTSYEVDDRPWLAAHGDGFVYYMSNTGYKHDGRLTIHRSTDAGVTFDPIGYTLPRSGWGTLEADPNSSYVYAFVNDQFYNGQYPVSGPALEERIWISPDRGATWNSVKVATLANGDNATQVDYPQVAVSPQDGTVYTLWADGRTLKLGRSGDHGSTWTTYDVTPFAGEFDSGALTVGPDGTVAIGFHRGTSLYVMHWRPESNCLRDAADPASFCTGPASVTTKIANEAAPDQEHFFQIRYSPDGALNIPYENNPGHNKYVRQTSGPSMSGSPICGHVVKA